MIPDPATANHVTSAILIVYAMKWAKSQAWYQRICSAAPGADRWFHRSVAAVGALIVSVGAHIVFDGSLETGYTFHGSVPPIATMIQGAWDWIQVFSMQQLAYDASRKPPELSRQEAIQDRNKEIINED